MFFADSHDTLTAMPLYRYALVRKEGSADWIKTPMESLVNGRWRGFFMVTELEHYQYTVTAWVDRFKSQRKGLMKRVESAPVPLHGRSYSMTFVPLPLSTVFFKHMEEKP